LSLVRFKRPEAVSEGFRFTIEAVRLECFYRDGMLWL
jgi:hypothetical protein